MQPAKYNQKLFILSVVLVLAGLFLPWYATGDLFAFDIRPLDLKWNTSFTSTGGRLSLPSLDQNIPIGLASLIGVSCLTILKFGRASFRIVKWMNFGMALVLLSISIYYLVSIWMTYASGEKIGQTPPGPGLYIFFLGSIMLFLAGLGGDLKKTFSDTGHEL